MARTVPRAFPRVPAWLVWGGVFVAVTLGMLYARAQLDQTHVSFVYLMVVLGASASSGRKIGVAVALFGFLAIDYFFQPPYNEFAIEKTWDWLVLVAYLATALVATHLLARATAEAAAARQRADEIDRLSSLGAETLSSGRAEDALLAIVTVIRETLDASRCEIWTSDDDGNLTLSAATGPTPEVPHPPPYELPLRTHDRTVGELRLQFLASDPLDESQRRILSALAYYAALAVERVSLVAEAEHAEALRQADKLKDALLASVSHDLRTPLTTIKAHAHDIATGGDERAAIIEEQADRLNRFVGDLLEMSRINVGTLPVRPELNAAEDLVGAAMQEVSGAFASRELRTEIAWSEPVLVGRFDFVHALRILVNLLENADKYSPRGEPIDLGLRREGDWLEITVADRGPGVPVAEREKIFEPFYRPPRVSPDGGGTGLGLAISRALASAQGGTVSYADREGGGSVFCLRLPAASPTTTPQEEAEGEQPDTEPGPDTAPAPPVGGASAA